MVEVVDVVVLLVLLVPVVDTAVVDVVEAEAWSSETSGVPAAASAPTTVGGVGLPGAGPVSELSPDSDAAPGSLSASPDGAAPAPAPDR